MSDNRYSRFLRLALLIVSLAIAVPAAAQITYIPIAGLPTEDVDMVELVPTPFAQPPTIIYPTETTVSYINMMTDVVYATVPKPGPNISGADYVVSPDGTIGVMPILGALCVFTHGPGAPALFMTIPLPGTPARRDIDVTIVPGLGAEPWDAIYATGTEVHRVNLSTGGIFWTAPLPTPIVEAVDPRYVPASNLVFAATDGFMSVFNATTGAPQPGTPFATGTTLTREVDIQLNPAGTLVYMPGTAVLLRFAAATGAFVGSVGLGSICIEGNDIAWDNTGTRGVIPTLANMVWFNAATGAITTLNSFVPYGHQRNMDVIFTAPGVVPQQAGYQCQGAFFTYTVPALPAAVGVIGVAVLPSPTMDGVDPLTTDATPAPAFPGGPPGVIALAPTQGFVTEIDLRTGAALPPVTLVPGVLRMDVDVRKGGTFGNKDYQPYIGGVVSINGFAPNQYTITVSNGVHRLDVSNNALIPGDFIPTPLIYRGGDEQVSTLLGPAAPGYTTDDPDQDFVSKCWDYKYAMNRWPMWYSVSNPLWYPHFMPYGVFGPPALLGWDIWNDTKVVVLNNQSVIILNRKGITLQTIPLPARPIGGLIWDWDNKICKLRLFNQQECVINLNSIFLTGFATVNFVPYGNFTEWYPIIDRMNGWEFVVERGANRIWCYDHLNNSFVTYINLPARIIRPPVFDEQRKTLCGALANKQVFFFNAHIYRQTLSIASALYYTPVLPAMCVADPVFDIYNHYTLLHLYGGNIVVCDNVNGNLLYQTGILPYWPIGPIQIDCFNKIAKWNAWNGAQFAEYWLNLYPLRYSLAPVLRTIVLGPAPPFGYPQFDSRDGWECTRIGNVIRFDYLFPPFPTLSFTPVGVNMVGNVFVDRINKYALIATNTNAVVWMNLFRFTQGLAGATSVISLPAGFIPTQGIHFVPQLHLAVVQCTNGVVVVINTQTGNTSTILSGLPQCQRQIYVHPFTGLCEWPSNPPAVDVMVDLNPLRQNPVGSPTTHVEPLAAPTNEAANFVGPPPISPALTTQMPPQVGDSFFDVFHFAIAPGGSAPGVNYQVDNLSRRNTANQMNPASFTTEMDGSGQFSIVGQPGETIRLIPFDPEGNAGPTTDIVVQTPVGVGPELIPTDFALAMTSANPVKNRAEFHFALPIRSHVELAIFDITGREVASLVSQDRPAGGYDEAWNLTTASGEPVHTGVYFVKFSAGGFKESKRIVVVN